MEFKVAKKISSEILMCIFMISSLNKQATCAKREIVWISN
jgi:hypothetical protein